MSYGIYTQPVIVRRWSLTNPSTFKKALHRFTFGMFGEPVTVQLEEFDTTMFFCGYSEPTPKCPDLTPQDPD